MNMSVDLTGKEVAQFGILDWEKCDVEWNMSPASDSYFKVNFASDVVWYLTQGAYKFYYTWVDKNKSPQQKADEVFQAQGNNADGEKEVRDQRSLSMGDIVVLSDKTVWLCVSLGWQKLGV
jgi:hypothetical protein